MEKINDIIESIANEKNLDSNEVKERVICAFLRTAQTLFGEEHKYHANIDPETKNIKLFETLEVVSDNDEKVSDETKYISLSKAKKISYDVENSD